MVYIWYITCICRPQRYVRYIPCQDLMGLFRTFFYNDTMYIPLIFLPGSDIPVIFNVYSMYILYILYSVKTMYIPCIYHVYTMYILSTYSVYYPYILGIYTEYVMNIHSISTVYYGHILHQVAGVEKEGRVPFH